LQFKVCNEDIEVSFSCANHGCRIEQAKRNLQVDRHGEDMLLTRFVSESKCVSFSFDGNVFSGDVIHEAVFFENTDYPLLAHAVDGKKINGITFALSRHMQDDSDLSNVIRSNGSMLFGALNFRNQVGAVDFELGYEVDGKKKALCFTTEVLSYKMDYRTDMKAIIADIEREYSMLAYSFLKQTYLSFQTKQGQSTELIWWQIFQDCYDEIIKATQMIISSPKRRLRAAIKYACAERLMVLPPEMENEYSEFRQDPNHLYRTEELFLSKDTVENRFLKHVIKELYRKFVVIRDHIQNSLDVADRKINMHLDEMKNVLLKLGNHRFFKGIGTFKGFTQDSMIMKQARGYKDIYRCWIELQCGYELEKGMHRLEVKDISELYEIWCFIKVKNIVGEILGGLAKETSTGKELTQDFIRQLVYGQQSEVVFSKDNIKLVSVMYNAQVDENNEKTASAIKDTDTLTTIQRPDIVLRLSKTNDEIQYTYLFDAKYRIADRQIKGIDVPPVDAINQMHRYRDAIYYMDNGDNNLKREVIGGYVLYPGNMTKDEFGTSYYKRSIDNVGIGAFPLKPTTMLVDNDGNAYIDPMSSENALHEQIRMWLEDENPRLTLLKQTIPQKGLRYFTDKPKDVILVNYANVEHWNIFTKNRLCYLRMGDAKGSVKLPAFGREPKYLLLHNGQNMRKLYRLIQDGALIYSKEQLMQKGFAPSQDGFYLCYMLASTKPVAVTNIDYSKLIREGKVMYTPHLEIVDRITCI